jgi:hypothetical protein
VELPQLRRTVRCPAGRLALSDEPRLAWGLLKILKPLVRLLILLRFETPLNRKLRWSALNRSQTRELPQRSPADCSRTDVLLSAPARGATNSAAMTAVTITA